MRRTIGRVLLLTLVTLLATAGVAAQGVKLRPLSAVYVDQQGAAIRAPHGVGCSRSGELIVADTGNARLVRYAVTDESIRAVAVIETPQVARPLRAETFWDGQLLVLDGATRKLVRFDRDGAFVGELDVTGATGTVVLRSFAVGGDDLVYLLDIAATRVLAVDSAGVVQREIGFPAGRWILADVAVDRRGRVYVLDSVAKQLFVAGGSETLMTALPENLRGKADFPSSLAVDSGGTLFVGDRNGGSVLALDGDGGLRSRHSKMGWKTGLLRYPAAICVDDRDHLFVADEGNDRIQVFGILR